MIVVQELQDTYGEEEIHVAQVESPVYPLIAYFPT